MIFLKVTKCLGLALLLFVASVKICTENDWSYLWAAGFCICAYAGLIYRELCNLQVEENK